MRHIKNELLFNTNVKNKRVTIALLTIAVLIATGIGVGLIASQRALAACTAPSPSYGSTTTTVSIPQDGTYRVWNRFKTPEPANNTFLLEIDGGNCYNVGGNSVTANSWTWTDRQSSGAKLDLSLTAGTHTFKFIGNKANLVLDRVIATTDLTCVPTIGSTGDNCATPADTIAPTVSITKPLNNAQVSGIIYIAVNTTDNTGGSGIARVDYYVDDTLFKSATGAPTYERSLDTATFTNGSHKLTARSYDNAGNSTLSSAIYFTIANGDVTAPVVNLFGIEDGATVSGSVSVGATATDNMGVTKVDFYVDGVFSRSEVNAPYCMNEASGQCIGWDTTQLQNGTHSIKATAVDAAGNQANDIVTFTVSNGDTQAPSTPTNVRASAVSSSRIDVAWSASTDNVGIARYCIARSDGILICPTGTTTAYSDTNVIPSTTYGYRVTAYDAANNASAASASVTATTPSAPDTSAPSAPANLSGQVVSSSQVNLSWGASSDNIGVANYEVYRGTTKIATVTSTSYGDAGLSANTSYTYYVIAKDAAGNASVKSNTITATTQPAPVSTGSLAGTISTQGRLKSARVSITVNGTVRYANANASGYYVLTSLPAGNYVATYSASGLKSQTHVVTISAGATTTKNVILSKR